MPGNQALTPLCDIEGAVVTDRYDRRTWDSMREESAQIQAAEEQGAAKIPSAPLLLRDFWAALYKADPRLREDPGSLAPHKKLVEMAQELGDWQDLRASSRLDQWASALSAIVVSGKVLESLPEAIKKAMRDALEAQKQAQQFLNQAIFNQDGAALAGANGQLDKAKELREAAARAQKAGQDVQAWAEEAATRAVEALQSCGKEVHAAIRAAARDAEAAIEQTASFGWGTDPGQAQQCTGKERFDLAWKLATDPRMKEIARLAGRMQNIAREKRKTRAKQEPSEVVDVELGNDLSRVLASELVSLRHPLLKRDFMRRFVESGLAQYRLEGKENLGRGPIVVCVDSSGSMKGPKEVWSKAVVLALFQIAAREKRAFACVHFGSANELKTFEFPEPRKAGPAEVAEMAGFFYGGGTDFEAPLFKAVQVIEKSRFNRADVVFVTDGECAVGKDFLKAFHKVKAEKQFSVISVLMQGGVAAGVRPFSDRVVYASPDDDAEALDTVFGLGQN